jgi:hypothetical protein
LGLQPTIVVAFAVHLPLLPLGCPPATRSICPDYAPVDDDNVFILLLSITFLFLHPQPSSVNRTLEFHFALFSDRLQHDQKTNLKHDNHPTNASFLVVEQQGAKSVTRPTQPSSLFR